jgi:hypothetical protein
MVAARALFGCDDAARRPAAVTPAEVHVNVQE